MDSAPDVTATQESTEIPLSQVPATVAVLPKPRQSRPAPIWPWLIIILIVAASLIVVAIVVFGSKLGVDRMIENPTQSLPQMPSSQAIQISDPDTKLRLESLETQTKITLVSQGRNLSREFDVVEGLMATNSAVIVDEAVYLVVRRGDQEVVIWTNGNRQRLVTESSSIKILPQSDQGTVLIGGDTGAAVATAGVVVFEVANTDLKSLPATPSWDPVWYDGQVSWWWIRQPDKTWGLVAINQASNRVDLYNLLTLRLNQSQAVFHPRTMTVVYVNANAELVSYNLETQTSSNLQAVDASTSLSLDGDLVVLSTGDRISLAD